MNFATSISTCLSKYVTFSGRATRSEFWWFYLFTVLVTWGAAAIELLLGAGSVFSNIVSLLFFVPLLAAGSRRLHDIGRSGWWQLLMLTVIGVVLLIVWWACDTKDKDIEYGKFGSARTVGH